MKNAKAGQRWVSETEPELGLGIVVRVSENRISVGFPAAGEQREYALASAPLRRVRYREGDHIRLECGTDAVVDRVEESGGLLVYHSAGGAFAEAELDNSASFSGPMERLLSGTLDDLATFNLRVDALRWRGEIRRSPARGFVGSRIDLIPHQLFVASEVSSRLSPRVLLADEVGLGKTIEAGLILHRLHLTGRANRVLVLVPEPLVHQWFVELLRRFNLLFSIFDEDRCIAIASTDESINPFADSQLVLASMSFFEENENRRHQAKAAGWDLVIVDEAHHLAWSPVGEGESYRFVAELAAISPGLLLLTATPQQLGPEGHFARLRLLDPERFGELAVFLEESNHYEEVARAVARLQETGKLDGRDRRLFAAKSPRVARLADGIGQGGSGVNELIAALVDEFGPGRVMFRNSRAALRGFPRRKTHLAPLQPADGLDATTLKVKWLSGFMRKAGPEKVLLICRSRELAEKIVTLLLGEIQVRVSLFHEGFTLMQRDRNAASFADEDGAQLLVCSEIGSEGRNFQFAHHLVLFDLPENPELLEQRIGRLDRIGQRSTIHLHVPYVQGTSEESWTRWYHAGLDAFSHSLRGASEIVRELGRDWMSSLSIPDSDEFDDLLNQTRRARKRIGQRLDRGYNRLLEISSCNTAQVRRFVDPIRELDENTAFEAFIIRLAEGQGMHVEEMSPRTWFLRPENISSDAVPGVPPEGMTFTFDRQRALSREHEGFLTCDHPLTRGLLDLLLGARTGNCAFAVWQNSGADGLILEAHFVIECVAPTAWQVDRFLPPTPVRVTVDHASNNLTMDTALKQADLMAGEATALLDKSVVRKRLLPAMHAESERLATEEMKKVISDAVTTMNRQLAEEIERLVDLAQVNPHVTPQEIEVLRHRRQNLASAMMKARLRVDALRMILRRA